MQGLSRRTLIKGMTLGATTISARQAWALQYPSRPIRVIVPYAAGASGDLVARLICAEMTRTLDQQFLIDNRPGAAGTMGAGLAAASAPDGYTLLLATDSQMAISPHIQSALPYKPHTSFTSIAQAAYVEFVLIATPGIHVSTVPELVSLLKANPGKFSYASHGIGSSSHLTLEWFKRTAGVEMLHVPYKGSSALLPDVIGGIEQVSFTGIAQTMPLVAQGKLSALATGAAQRLPRYLALPTISETYPGFEANASWNFFGPAGVPSDIVTRLNAEINRALSVASVRERLVAEGLTPIGGPPDQLTRRMRADYLKWGRIVQEIDFKPE